MSLKTLKWDETLLSACGGPDLKNKLAGEPVPGGTILGPIGRWWVERYNFSPGAWIIFSPFPWTLDRLWTRLHCCAIHRRQPVDNCYSVVPRRCNSFFGDIHDAACIDAPSVANCSPAILLHIIAHPCASNYSRWKYLYALLQGRFAVRSDGV